MSPSTVSRVLTGVGYVSAATKEKVLKAVDELGYNPNGVARSLKRAKTQTIGVIVPDISNPYFVRVVRSIENCVSKSDYNLLLCSTDDNASKEETFLRILRERRIDGLIFAPSRLELGSALKPFLDANIPVVLVDRTITDVEVDTVVEEGEQSSYRLVQSLIEMGHERIAIVNSKPYISTSIERQRGYERAMLDAGIPIRPQYIQHGRFDQETGYLCGKRLFTLKDDRPTAIFATNNSILYGLMLAARELLIRIPEDISLVSFGDLEYSELIFPRVTAILQHPDRVGTTAAEVLLARLNHTHVEEVQKTRRIVLPTDFRCGTSVRNLRD